MCDVQDPQLTKHGVQIDSFKGGRKKKDIRHYFLSHIHQDHRTTLTKGWRQETHGTIYCSPETGDMLSLMMPGITGIRRLEWKTWHKVGDLMVVLLPVRHCLGATMFLFSVDGSYVLYTGDFRYEKRTDVAWDILSKVRVDRVYVDDTFAQIDAEFPDAFESMSQLCGALVELDDGKSRVCLSVKSVGAEMLLEAAAKKLGIKYRLDYPEDSPVYKTLKYALGDLVDQKSNVVLTRPRDQKDKSCPWITLVCAAKACNTTFKSLEGKATKIREVYFCQHSSKTELANFVLTLNPVKVIRCQNALSC